MDWQIANEDDDEEINSDEMSDSSYLRYNEDDNENSDNSDDDIEEIPEFSKPTQQQIKQNKLRQANEFCDIILKAGDMEFPAHRVILHSSCEYFRCLIDHDAKSDSGTICSIDLKGVDPDGLEAILTFIYTNEIDFSVDTLAVILQLADYLNLKSLIDLCLLHIEKTISTKNVLSIFKVVNSLPICGEIVDLCLNIIGCDIMELSLESDFLSMSLEEFGRVLSHDKILILENGNPIYGREFLERLKSIVKSWSHSAGDKETDELLSIITRWCNEETSKAVDEAEKPKFLVPRGLKSHEALEIYGHHATHVYGHRLIQKRCNTYSKGDVICNATEWEINKIEIIKLEDWDNISPVVGMKFCYRHLWNDKEVWINNCPDAMTGEVYSSEIVELDPNEKIHSFYLRHGWMTNCITFYTTLSRQFGPYGTDSGGNPFTTECKPGRFLHGFSFQFINTQSKVSMDRISPIYSSVEKNLPIRCYYPRMVCKRFKK